MCDETWRPVVGYEGLYEVSNSGKIFSLVHQREIKPFVPRCGYLSVNLGKDGRRTCRPIHRLMAEAFLGIASSKVHVHHKNGNKLDNRLENFEYLHASDHMRFHTKERLAQGFRPPRVVRPPCPTIIDIVNVYRLLLNDLTVESIAQSLRKSQELVLIVASGEWRTHQRLLDEARDHPEFVTR